ncbi:hypothetical protein [Streptomyces sp. NPDC001876]|uniref:hypothetical protein n=1 Tax=Streptomyces sp. NPDC001876 TaxID=3154402 RepID=UPI00332C7078
MLPGDDFDEKSEPLRSAESALTQAVHAGYELLDSELAHALREVEQHVPTCQICSTYHEGRDVLQLLRSPALVRRLLAEAAKAYQGPTCYDVKDQAHVISPDAFESEAD